MTILIDYTPAIRQQAGIGRLSREIITRMPDLHPDTEIALFVNGRRGRGPRQVQGMHVHYTPLRERDMVRLWHRIHAPYPLVEWFVPCRPHLFHATDFVLPPSKAPCQILTVHDLAFRKYPETALPTLTRYLNEVVPRSVRRADFIIADSHSTAHDLQELWHVPAERIAVVPGGVDRREFREIRDPDELERVRDRYGLGDRPYILALSTLHPRKNFTRLVEAFHLIARDYPEHRLVIGGMRGWKHDGIFRRVMELDLIDRVLFPGFMAERDVPALYSGAAMFVYPSLYEGFGLPLLEAMACGAPVLTGRNSSLVEAGGAGALYVNEWDIRQLAEGMRRLLEDREKRVQLRRNGLRHAARFTWERSAQRLWEAYRTAWEMTAA